MGRRSVITTCVQIIAAFHERGEWTQVELATRCEVSTRTVRRILEELQAAGMRFDRLEYSEREVAWRYGGVPLALRGRRSDAGPRDPERLNEIRSMRLAGHTWNAIAERYGVTRPAVIQFVKWWDGPPTKSSAPTQEQDANQARDALIRERHARDWSIQRIADKACISVARAREIIRRSPAAASAPARRRSG